MRKECVNDQHTHFPIQRSIISIRSLVAWLGIYLVNSSIFFTWAECYYTLNYRDNWDPVLFTSYILLYNIAEWCCISWLAIWCSALYISTSYRVLVIHTYHNIWIIKGHCSFKWCGEKITKINKKSTSVVPK